MLQTIERLREYIPTIISNSAFDKYQGSIIDARSWIIDTLLGAELMETIEALAPTAELYLITERLLAYKAYCMSIPRVDLVETANGFAVVNDDKLLPASRERVAALVAAMEKSILQGVTTLLNFMEDTTLYRELWRQSPAYTIMDDSLIPTLREFRHRGLFPGSHLDFMAARPAMQMVIIRYIEPRISRELTREVIEQVRDNVLSDANRKIIADLQYAMAAFYCGDMEFGEMSLSRARSVMEANPDDYPTFKNSELYRHITAAAATKESINPSIYVM